MVNIKEWKVPQRLPRFAVIRRILTVSCHQKVTKVMLIMNSIVEKLNRTIKLKLPLNLKERYVSAA